MDERDDQPEYRRPTTTRGGMPDWAKAKPSEKRGPFLKDEIEKLKRRLFGTFKDNNGVSA